MKTYQSPEDFAAEHGRKTTMLPDGGKGFESPPRWNEAPPIGASTNKPRPVSFKTLAQFLKEYEPLDYTVDPIIRRRSLYTLTAKTGHGKTAFMIVMALALETGRQDL